MPRLKISTSTILQLLAMLIQIANVFAGTATSPNTKVALAAVVGIAQVGINTISHLSNPDGTDAKASGTK